MRFQLLMQTMKWSSLWACGFVGMAVLLNPIAPVFTPAGDLMLLLFLGAGVMLYPNMITEPYLQGELLVPTSEWAVV
jgi:hypothetical protein